MKTLVVTYTHGNEPPPEEWVERSDIVGNPRARESGVRFVETDLNRSFGVQDPKSYEEKRAKELQGKLLGYDLVIDVHRTDSPTTKFIAIIANKEHYKLTLPYKPHAVLFMPNASFSLIGSVPVGISLEYPKEYTKKIGTPDLFETIGFVESESGWKDMESIEREGEEVYPFLVGSSAYQGKCFIAKRLV